MQYFTKELENYRSYTLSRYLNTFEISCGINLSMANSISSQQLLKIQATINLAFGDFEYDIKLTFFA